MSVILIVQHDENIYNTSRQATTFHKKSPRYVSKHSGVVTSEYLNNPDKKIYGVLGLPRQPLPNPDDYLKKKCGLRHKVEIDPKDKMKLCSNRLQPIVPTCKLLEEFKQKKKFKPKDYMSSNIKNVMKMHPKEPVEQIAVTRFGATQKLSEGLEPRLIYEESFGTKPEYLKRFIHKQETDMQLRRDQTGTEQPICKYITRDERDNLMKGLKQNWQDMQKLYQTLPILTDTIPKVVRKSKLEDDLKQIEKDIVMLERHPYIYVYDDNKLPH